MPAIYYDSIVKMVDGCPMVAKLDEARGSRGFTVGWTGGQCMKKKPGETAEPAVAKGTMRYGEFVGRLSSLVQKIMSHPGGFGEPFQEPEGGRKVFASRRASYADKIHPGNVLEGISFRCYIQEQDWIGRGGDKQEQDWIGRGGDGVGTNSRFMLTRRTARSLVEMGVGLPTKIYSAM